VIERSKGNLLPMLHRMGENGFRVFMTSRRYADDIEERFRNVPSIEIVAHDDDIKSYIYERLDAYPSAKRMIKVAGLEDEVVSRLARAAGGM
jgi:inner membrane protein involved in colicin E2 resistance